MSLAIQTGVDNHWPSKYKQPSLLKISNVHFDYMCGKPVLGIFRLLKPKRFLCIHENNFKPLPTMSLIIHVIIQLDTFCQVKNLVRPKSKKGSNLYNPEMKTVIQLLSITPHPKN